MQVDIDGLGQFKGLERHESRHITCRSPTSQGSGTNRTTRVTTGGLSIKHLVEFFISQLGSMDQFDWMLVSSPLDTV